MNKTRKTILLKISGELLSKDEAVCEHIIDQISDLNKKCNLAIVVGGGNIFRGLTDGKSKKIPMPRADEIGMLATLLNGKMLQAMLERKHIATALLSAFDVPAFSKLINLTDINNALLSNQIIIFVGGTSCPYFSTDTASIVRGLQINADEIWKATKVDGVYDSNPNQNNNSNLIKKISYSEVLDKKLGIMDLTAITLAQSNNVRIRVFNLFKANALISAFEDSSFGSLIEK